MKWAGSPANLGVPVLSALMAINAQVAKRHGKVPLDVGEVSGIAKSVERYRSRWIATGHFYTEAERTAWGRERGLKGGLASGKARRKRTESRDREIVEDRAAGLSERAISQKQGLSKTTVHHILLRDVPLFVRGGL